jgi:hypothetical protein
MSRQLPPQPHLDVLKKQARQLLNDQQAGQAEAVARVQDALADLPPSAAEPAIWSRQRATDALSPSVCLGRTSAQPGQPVEAEIAFTDQTSYGEFVISMSVPTYLFRFAVDGLASDLVVSLGTPLVEGLLATGQGDRGSRLADLGAGLARDLESIWNPLTKFSVDQIEPHTDPFAVGAVPMYEVGVLIAFQVTANTTEGELSSLFAIFYPGSASRGVLDSLAAHGAVGDR